MTANDCENRQPPSRRASVVRGPPLIATTLIVFLSLQSLAGVFLQWVGTADRIAPAAEASVLRSVLWHD